MPGGRRASRNSDSIVNPLAIRDDRRGDIRTYDNKIGFGLIKRSSPMGTPQSHNDIRVDGFTSLRRNLYHLLPTTFPFFYICTSKTTINRADVGIQSLSAMSADLKLNSDTTTPEKSVQSEHVEGSGSKALTEMEDEDIFAENLAYGPDGIRGLVGNSYVFGAAALASLGGFSFGYDQGVISIINVMEQFGEAFPQTRSAFGTSFMTAMLLLGAFIGCIFMPYLADRISRKWALTVVVVIFDIGAIFRPRLRAMAPWLLDELLEALELVLLQWERRYTSLRSLRQIYEVPFSCWSPSPLCLASSLPSGSRTVSPSTSFLIRPGGSLSSAATRNAWPAKLRGLPPTDSRVQKEFKGIVAEVEFNKIVLAQRHPGAGSFKLENRGGVRSLLLPAVFRHNAFIYYAPTLFESIGQPPEMALILSGVFNILQLVAVAICFVVIDKVGQRPLAIVGGFGSCICYVVIAAIAGVYSKDWAANPAAGWAAVATAFCFIMVYGVSYSPLGWSLPPEVFPNSKRAKGVALSVCVNWISNFTVGIATPPMLETIGYGTYIFFAFFCGLSGIWALLLVPETKGKTLEQMDVMFGDNNGQEEKDFMRIAAASAEQTLLSQTQHV
ncbi:hypothetical protein V500_05523 [Pseudogymnoascus sp. VKM F-4518 (FW-2643)]|nr:hypothetical protein V500_05523 [Pseudogymnoascus sp. VKM F-4518 (FW-2643)]